MKKNNILNLKSKYQEIIDYNAKIRSRISYLRLILFALIVVFVSLYFSNYDYTLYLAILSLVLFIVAFIFHHKYHNICEFYTYKLTILDEYLKRFDDRFKNSSDSGIDLKGNNYFETDLDLFGKSSVYSYICFAKTPYGRYFLKEALMGNIITKEDLLNRQEAIKELANDLDKTTSILSSSLKMSKVSSTKKKSNIDNACNLLEHRHQISIYKIVISIILSVALITSLVLFLLKITSIYPFIALIFINFILAKLIFPSINGLSKDMTTINDIFYGYNYIFDEITSHEYDSELLNDAKNEVNKLNSKSFKEFKLISSLVSMRNNIIFQVLFNGTLLFDGYLLLLFKKWQDKYENVFKDAIMACGKFEEYASLSTISIVKEDVIIPEISEEFEFENIKHPLISEGKCIPNDFKFEGTNIITGSNMSGKTTFMRSIGVNYLLFLSGASVNATSFKAPISKLFTSMKVVDDVNNNISTFYGEVLRIKAICEYIKEDKPMIVLVDEIFKGTNTLDRITGATSVVEKLKSSKAISIITTHDYELCDIKGVNNYYFLEHYNNNQIGFDYKIRCGVSNTRNAIYLLKIAGVIDE